MVRGGSSFESCTYGTSVHLMPPSTTTDCPGCPWWEEGLGGSTTGHPELCPGVVESAYRLTRKPRLLSHIINAVMKCMELGWFSVRFWIQPFMGWWWFRFRFTTISICSEQIIQLILVKISNLKNWFILNKYVGQCIISIMPKLAFNCCQTSK